MTEDTEESFESNLAARMKKMFSSGLVCGCGCCSVRMDKKDDTGDTETKDE